MLIHLSRRHPPRPVVLFIDNSRSKARARPSHPWSVEARLQTMLKTMRRQDTAGSLHLAVISYGGLPQTQLDFTPSPALPGTLPAIPHQGEAVLNDAFAHAATSLEWGNRDREIADYIVVMDSYPDWFALNWPPGGLLRFWLTPRHSVANINLTIGILTDIDTYIAETLVFEASRERYEIFDRRPGPYLDS